MRRVLSNRWVASLCVAVLASVAAAAVVISSPAIAAPAGSYTKSCDNISTPGNDIKARCKTKSGKWIWAYLQNRQLCVSDIGNDNGVLVCSRAPGVAGGPAGSYQQTCRDIHRSGVVLFATCKRKDGTWLANSISGNCRGDIANHDGRLICNPAPTPNAPGGAGSQPFANCKFIGTETKCYGVIETCAHVYQCPTGTKKDSQKACGVCLGVW